MSATVRQARRVGWLDGLRGLAATQVVLLHYVFAFLPAIGMTYPLPIHEFWWRGLVTAPLVFLYDGSSAVYLFFIISGVALTYAFGAQPFAFPPMVARRIIRLGMPMAAAILLAAALYSLLPYAHVAAAELTGSPWFRGIGPREISVGSIAHQITFEGLLVGFRDWSLLPAWMKGPLSLSPSTHGFDAPLWTLHIEFCGSLLLMLLVALRASISRPAYHVTCAILGCAFVLSPMALFIFGHIANDLLRRTDGRTGQIVVGSVSLALGIFLCTVQPVIPVSILWKLLPPPPLGIQGDLAILQKTIGAILVFCGVALLPILQRQLEQPALRWLGRISFSLYLTHSPVLFTCAAACFIVLNGTLPYGASVGIVSATGIAASVAAAAVFERWIDRPSIMLSQVAGGSSRRVVTPEPAIETA